MSNLKEIY